GSDTLRLSEASGYSRDVVIVKRGDSTRTQTDAVLPSGINPTGSGFDTFSATASAHDVLDLQSRVIAADASNVDGIDSGVIARHDITSGIVTFRDASGTVVTIGQATNLGLALTYLEQNITTAGTTVAFRGDFDNNGVADSLWVFQDLGVRSGLAIADTVLRVGYANPTDLAAVTLGTAAGANVLQLQDTTTPDPDNLALVTGAAGGLLLEFTETVSLGAQFNTGLTLLKNGTTAMTVTATTGVGTNAITITTSTALADTDWVMVRPNYNPADPARLWQDEVGNLARLEPDDYTPVVGGNGDNTIDLSALTTGLSSGFDIIGRAGNDTIVGSAQADYFIAGNSGADDLTGGAGTDTFRFDQGDSTEITSRTGSNGSYIWTFGSGVDVVRDASAGETIELDGGLAVRTGDPAGVANGEYAVVRGEWAGTSAVGSSIFTQNGAGSDTLILWDGTPGSGFSAHAIVLENTPTVTVTGRDTIII
ncbi:MAG: hypothetical protein ING98_16890, partial [Rhodocyclaceae bacterium]|nr:hypothetical protein [Rhodocyclaceae bacterium]